MRRALGILTLLAVMVMAAAAIVLRGSGGFGNGQNAAVVIQTALASMDYASFMLGISAGMLLMWILYVPWGSAPAAASNLMRGWWRRAALVVFIAAGLAVLVYY
jgi:hypothetical protein